MKILKLILPLLLFISSVGFAQGDLNEYLSIAAENNPALKAKFSQYMAAVQQIDQVDALPDPQVTFGYFVSPVETRVGAQQFKISLTQKFPWFGKLDARADSKAKSAQIRLKEFDALKYKLFYDVKKIWYNIYINRKEVKLVSEQMMFYQALESLIETKYQSGKTGLADLMRIRIKLNDFQNKLDDLNSALLPLQADFNKLLSRPESDKVNVSEDITLDILEDDSSVRDSILANNANLSVMHQQKEAALSQIESSKLESYPDIAFGLDYAMVTERPDIVMVDNGKDILMPMLSMNIPLFSSKYDAKVQEYEYQSEMIDYQIQDYQNKLSADYQRIITDKQNSLRNIKYLERQIKESYDVLEILYTEYSTKGNNYLDLIMQKEQIIVYEYKLELEKVRVNLSDALIDMLNSKN